jgi:integrase
MRYVATNSFEAVAREWCSKRSGTWSPVHAAGVLRKLESDLFDEIGDKPVAEIDAAALLDAVRKIEARGAYDLAHRTLGVAGQVFRCAIATGRCKSDPSRDLRGALTNRTTKPP